MAKKGTILVGTIGQGVMMSHDAGKSWEQLSVEIAEDCPNVGIPRPTGIAIDPTNPRSVWVGLEVDGVRHSTDGGDSWRKLWREFGEVSSILWVPR